MTLTRGFAPEDPTEGTAPRPSLWPSTFVTDLFVAFQTSCVPLSQVMPILLAISRMLCMYSTIK